MNYRVVVPKPVQKQLDKIPQPTRARVLERILSLRENPRPMGSIKLKNSEREYRVRVGDYRVRYEIRDDEQLVILLHCRHRKDVYRD